MRDQQACGIETEETADFSSVVYLMYAVPAFTFPVCLWITFWSPNLWVS